MGKGYQAYYSDVVLGSNGLPVAGAVAAAFSTAGFANGTLPVGTVGLPTAAATAVSDAVGRFTFVALPPDDYHLLVTFTPPGGAQVVAWRYHVPIVAYDALRRVQAAERSGALARTLARLSAGLSVTIFGAGDDVTVGYNATGTTTGGWVALLAAQLAALYPNSTIVRQDPHNFAATVDALIPSWDATTVQTGSGTQTITLVNAGVKGDTVLRFLRRFANLTTSWPASDLVIAGFGLWESTVGGTQQFEGAADLASNLESMVNVVRTFSQAEVLLCTPVIPSSGNETYADAVRQVSARTRTDLADLRQLFLDRFVSGGPNGGYDPWLNTAVSSVLPTDAGHAAIAAELARHLAPAVAVPFAGGPFGAAKSWELVRISYAAAQLQYAGSGWSSHTSYQGSLLSASGDSSEGVTNHATDSLSIKGRFVDLHMLCRRFSDCGQISVVVDGGAPTVIDLYRAYPASTSDLGDANGAYAPQDRVTLAHGLTDTIHTVAITLLGTKNVASSGFNWRIEALELGRWRLHGFEVEANEAQSRVQGGTVVFPFSAQNQVILVINFPKAYLSLGGDLPSVTATSKDFHYAVSVTSISLTAINLTCTRIDGTNVTANIGGCWHALG